MTRRFLRVGLFPSSAHRGAGPLLGRAADAVSAAPRRLRAFGSLHLRAALRAGQALAFSGLEGSTASVAPRPGRGPWPTTKRSRISRKIPPPRATNAASTPVNRRDGDDHHGDLVHERAQRRSPRRGAQATSTSRRSPMSSRGGSKQRRGWRCPRRSGGVSPRRVRATHELQEPPRRPVVPGTRGCCYPMIVTHQTGRFM
jgi:hypothetical protein